MCQHKINKGCNLTQDLVYDLYCGIGTISCYIAKDVKKVIGLEYVDSAVENARLNAQLNGITNVSFLPAILLRCLRLNLFSKRQTHCCNYRPSAHNIHQSDEQLLAMLPEKLSISVVIPPRKPGHHAHNKPVAKSSPWTCFHKYLRKCSTIGKKKKFNLFAIFLL